MIDTTACLAAALADAASAGAVALDTEFVWERTYTPRLGLIQLAWAGDAAHLVDPVADVDLAPLGVLLGDAKTELVLHDAVQDLVILRRATGVAPRSVFDTRLAAGFAGLPATLSLADLLREVAGVDLPKTQTRTDWLRRPLRPAQLAYALDDVRHLSQVREVLSERVAARGRADWLAEDLASLDDPALYEDPDPRAQYLRIKGVHRLAARERAVLRELTAWREEEARRVDRPRRRVCPDGALLHLSRKPARSQQELARVKGLGPRLVDRCGEAMLAAIRVGLELPDADCPQPPPEPDDPTAFRDAVDRGVALVAERAAAAEMDAPLVATRAEVSALARAVAADDPLEGIRPVRGWRRELAGKDMIGLFRTQT